MVSLTDENRILVKYGLGVLKHTQRMGLQELLEIAGIRPEECHMKKQLVFRLLLVSMPLAASMIPIRLLNS